MRAYKITMLVIDFDNLGSEGLIETLESVNYPNDCVIPRVMAMDARDIGEWDDSHPLNNTQKAPAEFARIFK